MTFYGPSEEGGSSIEGQPFRPTDLTQESTGRGGFLSMCSTVPKPLRISTSEGALIVMTEHPQLVIRHMNSEFHEEGHSAGTILFPLVEREGGPVVGYYGGASVISAQYPALVEPHYFASGKTVPLREILAAKGVELGLSAMLKLSEEAAGVQRLKVHFTKDGKEERLAAQTLAGFMLLDQIPHHGGSMQNGSPLIVREPELLRKGIVCKSLKHALGILCQFADGFVETGADKRHREYRACERRTELEIVEFDTARMMGFEESRKRTEELLGWFGKQAEDAFKKGEEAHYEDFQNEALNTNFFRVGVLLQKASRGRYILHINNALPSVEADLASINSARLAAPISRVALYPQDVRPKIPIAVVNVNDIVRRLTENSPLKDVEMIFNSPNFKGFECTWEGKKFFVEINLCRAPFPTCLDISHNGEERSVFDTSPLAENGKKRNLLELVIDVGGLRYPNGENWITWDQNIQMLANNVFPFQVDAEEEARLQRLAEYVHRKLA